MNNRLCLALLFLTLSLSACQPAPPTVNTDVGTEFTLAPGQSASIAAPGLIVRLEAVTGDDRCPLGVQCAASGPVTLRITVEAGATSPGEFLLQTFTDSNGRAPQGPFEGIQDRVEYAGFLIRVVGVLPYPEGFGGTVKADAYRVTFVVTEK